MASQKIKPHKVDRARHRMAQMIAKMDVHFNAKVYTLANHQNALQRIKFVRDLFSNSFVS